MASPNRSDECRVNAPVVINEPIAPIPRDELPVVTIAVLSFNRREALRKNLSKITAELDYPPDKREIIVVDNASTDGSAEMVRAEFPDARLFVNDRNVGVSGWNLGFQHGRGAYILTLDDDCYVEGASLARAVSAASRFNADIVSFEILNPNQPGFSFNRLFNPGLVTFWGCAALFSRQVSQGLGGFDPGIFVYIHELEFSIRAYSRGYRHLFYPEVKGYHMKPADSHLAPNPTSRRLTIRNLAYISAKLFSRSACVRALANVLLTVVLAERRNPRAMLRYLTAAVRGARDGFRVRAPVSEKLSQFYLTNYIEFANPLQFRGMDSAHRLASFYQKRGDLYSLGGSRMLSFT